MLTARTHTVVSVLNDLKDAFTTLLEKSNKHPALLMMYAFIDICAALANDDPKKTNQAVFVTYLEAFMTPGSKTAIPPFQLWAARSALLHTFTPLGTHTATGKTRPTFYYTWPETKDDVRRSLEARGYANFELLSVTDIKSIAIWAYNGLIIRIESDPDFQKRLLGNAEHLLLTQADLQVQRFLIDVESALAKPTF